jgi:hypothetical protein
VLERLRCRLWVWHVELGDGVWVRWVSGAGRVVGGEALCKWIVWFRGSCRILTMDRSMVRWGISSRFGMLRFCSYGLNGLDG